MGLEGWVCHQGGCALLRPKRLQELTFLAFMPLSLVPVVWDGDRASTYLPPSHSHPSPSHTILLSSLSSSLIHFHSLLPRAPSSSPFAIPCPPPYQTPQFRVQEKDSFYVACKILLYLYSKPSS